MRECRICPCTDFGSAPACTSQVAWDVRKHPGICLRFSGLASLRGALTPRAGNWGGKGARKKFKVVRSSEPTDLVFQSLRSGAPMNDQNILRRHLRPAARKLGIDLKKATWHSLRRSWGTWMGQAGADLKSIQGQMRHSRISTTMDIYAQFVPEAQQRAVARTMEMLHERAKQTVLMN